MKLAKFICPLPPWKQRLVGETHLNEVNTLAEQLLTRTRLLLRSLIYYGSKGEQVRPKNFNILELEVGEHCRPARPGNASKQAGRRPSLGNQLTNCVNANKPRSTLIGRLVSRWVSNSIAADLRRNAAKQLISKGSGVCFGLVGVYVQNRGPSLMTELDEAEARCQEIRSVFTAYFNNFLFKCAKYESSLFSLTNLEFGDFVAKGCNAVVYDAKLKGSEPKFAVKMMFNYDAESNATAIWKSMNRECITFNGSFCGDLELENALQLRRSKLKPHPNVIEILGVFADQVPFFPDAVKLYPNALPQRLNEEGYGRNMTLFLVMKKYDVSLKEFLSNNKLDLQTSLFLLAQLFEGVAHLVKNKVAHRDIKSDNVLLDLSHGVDTPWLVITDFGFCATSLQVPLTSDDVGRGGNRALMAPEVITAVPGRFSYIDYSASDLWSCGTLAYEIFNQPNPFSGGRRETCLQSYSYKQDELPTLEHAPLSVASLVKDILRRNPIERPSPKVAASLCEILLFSSARVVSSLKSLQNSPEIIKCQKLLQWLRTLSTATFCNRRTVMSGNRLNKSEMKLRLLFLSEVKMEHLLDALFYLDLD